MTPEIKLACPICRRDMEPTDIYVEPADMQEEEQPGKFYLRCCCSLDDMYVHPTQEDAEKSMSIYKGMAVKAGISVAWERLKERYEMAQEQLGMDAETFMVENADHLSGSLCRVYREGGFKGNYYCRPCLPKIVGDQWEYVRGRELPRMCCRCKKVATGGYGGGGLSGCPGDVAARDSF